MLPTAAPLSWTAMRRLFLPLLVLLCAVVFVVGTIGPPLWGQGVFHGSELMMVRHPWKDMAPEVESTWRYGPVSDTVDGTLPARAEFAERAGEGELGLWNPYIVGGAPLGSSPTGGVWSPLNTPYLLLPLEHAPAAVKLLEMAGAIGFTFLFLRRLKVGQGAAILGGIIFSGSAVFVMWNNWTQPQVAVLIPALFWTVERFVQLRTLRSAIPVALASSAIAIGGFPAVAMFAFTLLGPYALVRLIMVTPGPPRLAAEEPDSPRGPPEPGSGPVAWVKSRMPQTVTLVAALVAGGMLSAFLLLPFASQLGATDLSYRSGPGPGLPVEAIPTLVSASAAGWSVDNIWLLGSNQVEVISYVGAAAVALALTGVALRPSRGVPRGVRSFFVAGTVWLVLVTFVDGPHLTLLQELPLYDSNPIGRIRSLLGFFVAVLAALGFDAAWRSWQERATRPTDGPPADGARHWPRRIASLAVYAVGGGVLAYTTWELLEIARPVGERRYVLGELAWPAAFAGITLVAVAIARFVRHRTARWALAVVPVLVVVQGLAVAWPLLPRADDEHFYPVTSVHTYLDEHLGSERYASHGLTMYPGSSTVYRQRAVNGHTFYQPTWKDLLLTVDPMSFDHSPTHAFLDGTPEVITSPILDRMATRYFVLNPEWPAPGDIVPLSTGTTSTALGPGESLTLTTDARPVRGVTFELAAPFDAVDERARIAVEITPDADESPTTATRLLSPAMAPGPVTVGIAAEDLPETGTMQIEVTFESEAGALELATDEVGEPAVELVVPVDDGLRVVHDDGAVVLERAHSLPRIRWAQDAEVVADPEERLARLAEGVPGSTVVLSEPLSEPLAADAGAPATVDVRADEPERIEVAVDAEDDGYLVVADALQEGWQATIDGETTPLLEADHGAVAVAVPSGERTVALTYVPEGRRSGLVITGATAVALLALWWVGGRWRSARWNPESAHRPGSITGRDDSPAGPDSPAT